MSPIVRNPRERSHRTTLRVSGHCPEPFPPYVHPHEEGSSYAHPHEEGRPCEEERAFGSFAPTFAPIHRTLPAGAIMLAGADADQRAMLRDEIAATLPRRTRFCEADDVAEVLEHAPFSRLVVLVGDLEDLSADSLMRLLGQRHPQLPVVHVQDAPVRTVA